MRVETLILNFSMKDGLKIVSKTKIRNCWSMIRDLHLCTSYTVYLESLKTLYKKTIYIYLYIYFETEMFRETLDKNGLGFFHFN